MKLLTEYLERAVTLERLAADSYRRGLTKLRSKVHTRALKRKGRPAVGFRMDKFFLALLVSALLLLIAAYVLTAVKLFVL
jgi:hypothetical protein